jgi:hypothetical protein
MAGVLLMEATTNYSIKYGRLPGVCQLQQHRRTLRYESCNMSPLGMNWAFQSTSEYLAQYVFSMFGTTVLIPRQEDYGIDLFVRYSRSAMGILSGRMRTTWFK